MTVEQKNSFSQWPADSTLYPSPPKCALSHTFHQNEEWPFRRNWKDYVATSHLILQSNKSVCSLTKTDFWPKVQCSMETIRVWVGEINQHQRVNDKRNKVVPRTAKQTDGSSFPTYNIPRYCYTWACTVKNQLVCILMSVASKSNHRKSKKKNSNKVWVDKN